MSNTFTGILTLVGFMVVALFCAVEIGQGDYDVGIAAGVLMIFLVLLVTLGRKLPLEGLMILGAVVGYMILGKGFAYRSVGRLLFVGELTLGVSMIFYLARMVRGEFSLLPQTPIAKPLLLLGVVSMLRLWVDFQSYGLMALRDSCLIYYTIYFFIVYQLARHLRVSDVAGKLLVMAAPAAIFVDMTFKYIPSLAMPLQSVQPEGIPLFLPHDDATTSTVFGLFMFLYAKAVEGGVIKFRWLFLSILPIAYTILNARGAGYLALICLCLFLLAAKQYRFFAIAIPGGILGVIALALVMQSTLGEKHDFFRKAWEQFLALFPWLKQESHDSSTTEWRLYWWRKIVRDVWNENPIFGLGFGPDISTSFQQEYFRTSVVAEVWSRTRGAHNAFFTILARVGWLGVTFFVWAIAVQVSYFWKAANAFRLGQIPPRVMFCWGFLISGFVITFFQYTWEAPYSAIPFWTCCGLAYAHIDALRDEAEEEPELAVEPVGRLVMAGMGRTLSTR